MIHRTHPKYLDSLSPRFISIHFDVSKFAERVADPDVLRHLIWVYTVCSGFSVRIFMVHVNTVKPFYGLYKQTLDAQPIPILGFWSTHSNRY